MLVKNLIVSGPSFNDRTRDFGSSNSGALPGWPTKILGDELDSTVIYYWTWFQYQHLHQFTK